MGEIELMSIYKLKLRVEGGVKIKIVETMIENHSSNHKMTLFRYVLNLTNINWIENKWLRI